MAILFYLCIGDRFSGISNLYMLMGTNHCSRPYDLKKDGDIIEAATMATAEYDDLEHYWGTLSDLSEALKAWSILILMNELIQD